MKKRQFILFLCISLALLGCHKLSQRPVIDQKIYYSNLYDKESQMEVKKLLQSVGISPNYIHTFLANVDHYNYVIHGQTLVKKGFELLDQDKDPYDYVAIGDRWNQVHPDFIGFNCRITSFGLVKDFITIDKRNKGSDEIIVFDKYALENAPNKLFNQDDQEKFEVLFSTIPTLETKDIQVHRNKILAFYRDRGVSFQMPQGLSLISVFLHDQLEKGKDYLFVGHGGVLIKDKESYLFLEKLSFSDPYQAVKFQSKDQLRAYLMKKYDLSYNQPTAKPILFENGDLMK